MSFVSRFSTDHKPLYQRIAAAIPVTLRILNKKLSIKPLIPTKVPLIIVASTSISSLQSTSLRYLANC